MLNRDTHLPLYYQLKQILISRIAGMQHHELFPSEPALVQAFQVSRGTVKQAVMELVQEGYLYRVQGKGTFVSPPRIERSFGALPSFTEDIRRKGYVPESNVLRLELSEPQDKVREALRLPTGVNVWCLERVTLADGIPVTLVRSYLRDDVYPDLGSKQLSVSLYQSLERLYGKVPVTANDTYVTQPASQNMAETLSIRKGTPVIYSERIAYLANGIPAEYVESYMRGDRFIIHVTINAPKSQEQGAAAQGGENNGSAIGIRPRDFGG